MIITIAKSFYSNENLDNYYLTSNMPIALLKPGAASTGWYPQECISLYENQTPEECIKFMTSSGTWNRINARGPDLVKNIEIATKVVGEPQLLLENPKKHILTDQPTEKRWKIHSTSQKHSLFGEVQDYIRSIGGTSAIEGAIMEAADEFFTNSLFNAPFSDNEFSLDRSHIVVLDADMAAEMIVIHNKDKIFIGCVDFFGTMDCDALLKRLERCFSNDISDVIDMGKGGAGIGLWRIVDLSSEIFVVVEKDKRTLVGSCFPLGKSLTKTRNSPKNYYFQSYATSGDTTLNLTVEKRNTHFTLRLAGDLSSSACYKELDLSEAETVNIDFHQVMIAEKEATKNFLNFMGEHTHIKNIQLDYVPRHHLDVVCPQPTKASISLGSLYVPFDCPKCKKSYNILFKRQNGASPNSSHDSGPQCPVCNQTLLLKEKF